MRLCDLDGEGVGGSRRRGGRARRRGGGGRAWDGIGRMRKDPFCSLWPCVGPGPRLWYGPPMDWTFTVGTEWGDKCSSQPQGLDTESPLQRARG